MGTPLAPIVRGLPLALCWARAPIIIATCCSWVFRDEKSPYSSRFYAVRYNESSSLLAMSGSRRIHSAGASGFRCCKKLTLHGINKVAAKH